MVLGRISVSVIYSLLDEVSNAIDNGQCSAETFCDLNRAFDCADHNILLKKLELYLILGVVADWFTLYLTNRLQFVKIT